MNIRRLWPFVLNSTHRAVQMENYTLRDALREANKELLKHRALIASLRTGGNNASEIVRRILNSESSK